MRNLSTIKGLLLQELFITKRSLEIFVDIFLSPFIMVAVFGYISVYLVGETNQVAGFQVLSGILLWEFVWVAQYSVTVGALWNVWSHNLSNMFIAPLSIRNYMTAHIISGVLKAWLVFVISGFAAFWLFGFNILDLGLLNLVLFSVNLILFALSAGWILLGLIFRYGTRIQAIAWSVIAIIQPLCAAFFPLSVLPPSLQKVAKILPPSYVFESGRNALSSPAVDWQSFITALGMNVVFFAISILVFLWLFRKSRESGQFAKNDG